MALLDYVLLALATAASLAAAAGGIMLTLPQPRLRAIRLSFWFAAICFGSLGVLWASHAGDHPVWIRVVVASATAAIAAGGLTYMLSVIQDHAQEGDPGKDTGAIYLEGQVVVMPTTYPVDGRLYVIPVAALLKLENPGIIIPPTRGAPIEWPGKSGEEIKWNDSGMPQWGVKYQISNYGNNPIFRFQTFLSVNFFDVVKTANGSSGGKLLSNFKWQIDVPKIDAGKAGSYTFYVVNVGNDLAEVAPPTEATYLPFNETERKTTKLKVIAQKIEALFPGPIF